MNRTFSKMMLASEGRYMTALETEEATRRALELPFRMRVSSMIHQNEYAIVDYATQLFCDTFPSFDAPPGSLRRKKGHQDGRIVLRYIAQAVREGSPEILFEKVLSWLVGHLDNGNVTGFHMEVFFHFLQQGARRELPKSMRPFVDSMFELAIACVRQATHSGTIHRAHRRIAEHAATRMIEILPEIKTKYGVGSLPKCKRDFELLVKELARVMRLPNPMEMQEQLAGWLIERLINQVDYSPQVWHWAFLAIREGIVECCGPETSTAVNAMFESFADNAAKLLIGVKLTAASGEIADLVADRLIDRGESPGLLRTDEFRTTVSMVNRQLIATLATIVACGESEGTARRLADLWGNVVVPQMPSSKSSLLAMNLKVLLEVVSEKLPAEVTAEFRAITMKLVDVARRTEAAERIATNVDQVANEAAGWAIDNLGPFAADRRASFRDVRIVLSHIVTMIPSGPATLNAFEFKQYLVRFLLPNLPFNVSVMHQAYQRVVRLMEQHSTAEDAKLVRGYLDEAMATMERYGRMHLAAEHTNSFSAAAVDRGYRADPMSESLQRHGVEAGRRDASHLVEKAVEAAIIGGQEAEFALHDYFINEQVRHSKLPGRVVVEFVRGLLEHLRDYPEVAQLFLGLAQAAPAYTAAMRLNNVSVNVARTISERAMANSPTYRGQIGEAGFEACARDNGVMLRGLAHFLLRSPMDTTSFNDWWNRRVGSNISRKPDNFDSIDAYVRANFKEAFQILRGHLDHIEMEAIESFTSGVSLHNKKGERGQTGEVRRLLPSPAISDFNMISFADIAV